MLLYIYTGTYEAPKQPTADNTEGQLSCKSESVSEAELLHHVKMYVAADKYNIPDLKSVALEMVREVLSKSCNGNEILAAFRQTIENTREDDTELRNLLLSAMRNNISTVLSATECENELGSMAFYLFRYILDNGLPGWLPTRQFCNDCQCVRDVFITKRYRTAACAHCRCENLRAVSANAVKESS